MRLEGATLPDLVQMECLQRSRKIVRVGGGGRSGLLYFRDGGVVHAVTGTVVGEPALREILCWPAGLFETWAGEWPPRESISLSLESLLLRAAHAEDQARPGQNVLSFPSSDGAQKVAAMDGKPAVTAGTAVEIVRLSANGRVLGGSAGPEFSEAVAYAAGLADIVGELLGLEGFVAVELALSNQTACLMRRHGSGDILAARAPRAADLDDLRRQMGA